MERLVKKFVPLNHVKSIGGFLGKLKADSTATLPSPIHAFELCRRESVGDRVLWLLVPWVE